MARARDVKSPQLIENRDYLVEVIATARKMLADQNGLDNLEKELAHYLNLRNEYPTARPIFKRLLISLTNKWIMLSVIGEVELMREAFFGFDHSQVLREGGWRPLLWRLKKTVPRAAGVSMRNPKSLWLKFATGAFDCANFMGTMFAGPDSPAGDFHKLVDSHCQSPESAWQFAKSIARTIDGLGPTLCCDFLKEIGAVHYCKPDVWVLRALEGCRLIPHENCDLYLAFHQVWRISDATHSRPVTVDKILWIMGSGRWSASNGKEFPKGCMEQFLAKVHAEILPRYLGQ
jgi:hypothetical protein